MSNYHILQANRTKTQITAVFHYQVPSEINFAGKTLIECIVEDDFITKETRLPAGHTDQTEIDAIEAGEIIEENYLFEFRAGLSNAEIRDKMDLHYQDHSATALDVIRARYAFWGYDRDIP